MASVDEHPIHIVLADDDLQRNRLTVVFRLLLAIPVLVWLVLRGIAAFVAAFVGWLAVLVQGQVPEGIHAFVASFLRYGTQVSAYLLLAANPYPWFRGQDGYPIDLEVAPAVGQGRWGALFRVVLALPALLLAAVLGGGLAAGGTTQGSWESSGGSGDAQTFTYSSVGGVASAAAFLAWFAILALGREPRGLRDLTTFGLGYGAQAWGYLLLLTPRYPSSDPAQAETYAQLPEHPVGIVVDDDLARPRLTVLFRLLLAIPHLFWIMLWSIAAFFAAIVAWLATLVTGQVPDSLHRFLAAYVRYAVHLGAFVYLVGRRFPGFTGRAGSYGIDVAVDPPTKQNRWKVLFRFPLAIPAFILASAFGGVVLVVALLGWWYALATGRMPEGLRNLGAVSQRYAAQTYAYALLLAERYPYAAPVLRGRPEPDEPEDQAEFGVAA